MNRLGLEGPKTKEPVKRLTGKSIGQKTRITGHTSEGNVPNEFPKRDDKMIVIL